MTVLDLNEIYKLLYYKYILSFKLLDIIGANIASHLKPCTKTESLGQCKRTKIYELNIENVRKYLLLINYYFRLIFYLIDDSYTLLG